MCLKQSVLYSWNVPHSSDHMKSMCSRPLTNPFTIRTQTCTLNIRKKDKKEKMTARQTDWVGNNQHLYSYQWVSACKLHEACWYWKARAVHPYGTIFQRNNQCPGVHQTGACGKCGLIMLFNNVFVPAPVWLGKIKERLCENSTHLQCLYAFMQTFLTYKCSCEKTSRCRMI